MDWNRVFYDIHKLMHESNQMLNKVSLMSDAYWQWFIPAIGSIEVKYNRNPLVIKFLSVILETQDENCKLMMRRNNR